MTIETNLSIIAGEAELKLGENEDFRTYLQQFPQDLDPLVFDLNRQVEAKIDCTRCGNCCRTLLINVTAEEAAALALRLDSSVEAVKRQFLEESTGGQLVINTVPCHFLSQNSCSIYTDRFSECRAFPHLNKPGFRQRLFGTLMHYGRCPIIYNVVEALKIYTSFTAAKPQEI
jgi:uncharacterized protein